MAAPLYAPQPYPIASQPRRYSYAHNAPPQQSPGTQQQYSNGTSPLTSNQAQCSPPTHYHPHLRNPQLADLRNEGQVFAGGSTAPIPIAQPQTLRPQYCRSPQQAFSRSYTGGPPPGWQPSPPNLYDRRASLHPEAAYSSPPRYSPPRQRRSSYTSTHSHHSHRSQHSHHSHPEDDSDSDCEYNSDDDDHEDDEERRRRRRQRRDSSGRQREKRRRSHADIERDIEDAYSSPTLSDTLLLIADTVKGAVTGQRS